MVAYAPNVCRLGLHTTTRAQQYARNPGLDLFLRELATPLDWKVWVLEVDSALWVARLVSSVIRSHAASLEVLRVTCTCG